MDSTGSANTRSPLSKFDHWKHSYALFESALDSLLKESISLNSIFRQSDTQKWPGFEEATQYIGAVYTSLENHISQLHRTRAVLSVARNQSRKLVPLNKLPIETLVYILSLANASCILKSWKRDMKRPILQHVFNTSQYLRNIVTRSPSLWTHVDLISQRSDALNYGKYCVRYSGQLLLHTHIFEDEKHPRPGQYAELARVLRPGIDRIVSLDFQSSALFAGGLLAALWHDGSFSSRVQNFYFSDHLGNFHDYYNDFFSVLGIHSAMFVKNFQRLKLDGPFVPLNNSVYRNLTVFKFLPISSDEPDPTVHQLTEVLAACLNLRSLALVNVHLQPHPEQYTEVTLPKLKVLDLRQVSGINARAILSCINAGSDNLALCVTIPEDEDELNEDFLRRYIRKSKVTRLLIGTTNRGETLDWLFGSTCGSELSGVRELALVGYEITALPASFVSNTHRFSGLQTLHLLRGSVDPNALRQALGKSMVQELRVENCVPIRDFQRAGQMIAELSEFIPSVKKHKYSTLRQSENDVEWPTYQPW